MGDGMVCMLQLSGELVVLVEGQEGGVEGSGRGGGRGLQPRLQLLGAPGS